MPCSTKEKQRTAQAAWKVRNRDKERERERERRKLLSPKEKEQVLLYNREWREINKESISVYNKQYREKNRAKSNARGIARNKHNLQARLRLNLRKRLRSAILGPKVGSAVSDLGCSIPELILHLEFLWVTGMSWQTYGRKGWHIDHIRPLSEFDLSFPEHVAIACHFTNLQPLWAADNMAKGGKKRARQRLAEGVGERLGSRQATRVEIGDQGLGPVPVSETRMLDVVA